MRHNKSLSPQGKQVSLPGSKGQINRAGDALRRAAGGEELNAELRRESLAMVREYRAAHGYPLTHVRTGLAYHARKAAQGSWFDLSQRLKQLATITDKLTRMPKTNLARMQDIGGCRAVFLDQATVDTVIGSIEKRARRGDSWEIVDLDDYVDGVVRLDGYRAKHLIVRKHGVQIEIQLRTAAQHNWAQLVEELDKALGLGLKIGKAPAWAVDSVASAAGDMRDYESGMIDRDHLVQALNASLSPILSMNAPALVIR